ncbi:MAG: hypothetical protein LBO21_06795 [Synergistaceae bacterium]|jgi:tetratricopeptide (TPR) repeat protein|nr:hypothetical protein [Synergistaceae bacterium]
MLDDSSAVRVSFLGRGEVYVGDELLRFPYQKARVLFFAVAEEGRWDRRVLCERIWGDSSAVSMRNMRNALSVLRRILPSGFIKSDRTWVEIARGAPIESDIDDLDESSLDASSVSRFAEQFLSDPALDCQWVEERREYYRRKIRRMIERKMSTAPMHEKNFWRAWIQGDSGGGVEEEARELPFVRAAERDAILDFLGVEDGTARAAAASCVVICGEEGSGKSTLAEEICRAADSGWAVCFRGKASGEGSGPGDLLNGVLDGVLESCDTKNTPLPIMYKKYLDETFQFRSEKNVDLNPHLLGRIFAYMLDIYHGLFRGKIMLVLEDAHWAGRWIPYFLKGLFENLSYPDTVVLTCYPEFTTRLDASLQTLEPGLRRMETRLTRLSPEQIGEICGAALPRSWLTPDKLAEIYEHTGGNCFLLHEFLNCYDSNDWSSKLDRSVSDIAESRMLSLSEDESHLLDCVAAFPDEAPFEPLKDLSGFGDNELVSLCERLRLKGLLYERPSGDTYVVMFRYALVKKRVCGAMSGLKWWNLHKRLLEYYRTHSENTRGRKHLALVAHHAGDAMTELEARVEDLKSHFEFNHELFPKLSDAELFGTSRTLNDTFLTGDYLSEAWGILDSLTRERGMTPALLECERTLLSIKGGYLRWNGDYDDAASYLEEAMSMARRSRFRDEAMAEVLEQYCYIGIQKDDAELLRESVYKFYRLVRKRRWRRLMGTGLRFLAVLRIMEGDYDRAGRLLSMSAGVFEELEAKGHGYTISVIAAVHYHGDIAMHLGRYGEAVSCYNQCVRMCEAKGFYRGICLHLAKAAWCETRLGLMREAREHLAAAAPFLEGFQSRRGAGICGGEIIFGLAALFDMWDGMPRSSCANLRNAEDLSGIMHKPLWNAILLCIKALLRDSGEPSLLKMLPLDAGAYLAEAERILRRVGLSHELGAFESLREYRGSGV